MSGRCDLRPAVAFGIIAWLLAARSKFGKLLFPKLCIGILVLFTAVSRPARGAAVDVMFGPGSQAAARNIYQINGTTGVGTVVYTNYPVSNNISAAMAMRSSDGLIFYIGGQNGNDPVYKWDPATPLVAPVFLGNTGIAEYVPRLTFSADGTLYALNTNGNRLYKLSTTTGAADAGVALTSGDPGGGDIAFAPNGTLYMVSSVRVYTVPVGGGAVTQVGTITGQTGANNPGLAFDYLGRMVVIDDGNPASYYSVDMSTFVATRIGAAGAPGTSYGDLASAPRVTVSGKVFEDVNYGGGAGRASTVSGASPCSGARVELYGSAGSYLGFTTTDGSGNYTFTAGPGNTYTVRVVSSTVTSSRPGYVPGLLPVQTYRTNASSGTAVAVTDYVGGENPGLVDAGNGSTTLAALTTATTTAQSITTVAPAATGTSNIDFGFNFDTIVNVNDTGQGGLRQFITNANALSNVGLAQVGQAAGKEVSIFMISDGTAHAGLRAGLANLLIGGVAVITPSGLLPSITGADTTIDGTTQTANVGDTNSGTLGTGGTVGVDGLAVPVVNRPEVQVIDNGTHLAQGLDVQASNVAIRGLAVYGFGNDRASGSGEGNIQVGAVTGALIEQNIVGTSATSFTDPGAARTLGDNITLVGSSGAIIRKNLLGYASYMGVLSVTSSINALIEANEIRGNGIGHANQDGVSFEGSSGTGTVRGNRIADTEGNGVDMPTTSGANTIVNNTITGNGIGTDATLETPGVRLTANGNRVDRNIITANFGAGVMVKISSSGNQITRNSIFANGTITNKGGGGPSGQIGIDLLSASDAPKTGTAPFITINDNGDVDAGGNDLLNFPVFESAVISGGNLILKGWARPGAVLEIFIADNSAANFGQGKTYLTTLTEGSGADTDPGTGTYTNPVNGLNQGTDTTNRFMFTIPVPGGVAAGTKLTATATDTGGSTSEFSGNVTVGAGSISGKVFEDVNYGGGAGRDFTTSGGVARQNATVELYDSSGNFVSSTTTDSSGNYTFSGVTVGNNTIRVVNSTVTSSRAGYVAGLLPAQTFRTNGLTGTTGTADPNRVGGENPALVDAGSGSAGTTMNTTTGAFTAGITGQAESITTVTVGVGAITGIDFGFNFDTIVNVNNTDQGSLRQFITNANTLGGDAGLAQAGLVAAKENAVFMISNGTAAAGLRAANNYFTGGIATIAPLNALPTITSPLLLDATRQPGWISAPIIELNGISAGGSANGFTITAGSSIVRGFIINRFLQSGIVLSTGGSNLVQGNYLGTNASGTAGSQNDQQGVYINGSSGNTIGGTTPAQRNLISGNRLRGILVDGAGATGNTIVGNYVGLNAAGTDAVANIIGIFVNDAPNNTIGGTAAGASNFISGNTQIGLYFVAAGSTGNVAQGNVIGLNGTASGSVPNGTRGVEFVTGASNNTLGGVAAGAPNIIATNGGGGVRVITGTGNRVQRNSIYGNTGLGLNLGLDNVTGNNGAVGGGPNNGMDYPVFTIATLSGATLKVTGYIGSAPGQAAFANAIIEIFKADNSPADQNGEIILGDGQSVAHGEGRTYLGSINADASGNFNTSLTVAGLSIGDIITGTSTNAGNDTSEFSPNIVVTLGGGSLSGFVYDDANLNLQRDSTETGTGLTLYVKLINTTSPSGPALAAAPVDPASGAYILSSVATGIYTLVLDDNNTLSDVTPALPPGWTGTEMPTGSRTPVSVGNTPVPNQNFGLYHGVLISGRVFNDNGASGGVANDGTLNGGETGIAEVALKLTDSSGATVHGTAITNGAGQYALAIPSTIAAGTQLKIVETNQNSFVSTGATIGNTAGTYGRLADTITFTLVANTTYTNVNFGDVASNILSTDGQQAGLPGTTLFYAHTFTAGSVGSVAFSTASTQTPAFPGWTATLYRDTNANGQLDAGEPAITAPITLAASESVFIIVKLAIPTNAPFGAQDQTKLTANFTYTGATPILNAALTRQDLTTVGNPTTAGLRLTKAVDKTSALPGETITYTITYTNTSSDILSNVIIYDTTPAFTKFANGGNGPLPPGLTGVVLTAPAPGTTGAMRWTFAGTLTPAGTGTVTFTVVLDQ